MRSDAGIRHILFSSFGVQVQVFQWPHERPFGFGPTGCVHRSDTVSKLHTTKMVLVALALVVATSTALSDGGGVPSITELGSTVQRVRVCNAAAERADLREPGSQRRLVLTLVAAGSMAVDALPHLIRDPHPMWGLFASLRGSSHQHCPTGLEKCEHHRLGSSLQSPASPFLRAYLPPSQVYLHTLWLTLSFSRVAAWTTNVTMNHHRAHSFTDSLT